MKTLIRVVLFAMAVVAPLQQSLAMPQCNYTRLHCGATCRYQQGWGGACSGTAQTSASYCWSEMVRSDYGSWWMSCQEGPYDVCCDEITPN